MMSGIPLSYLIEGGVAFLLLVTIGYCVVLNDKLKKLRSDREALKAMVADLVQATELANSAIGGLKDAAADADAKLEARLAEADQFAVQLANHVSAGQGVMERIALITNAAGRNEVLKATPAPTGAHAALERLAAHQKQRGHAA